MNTCPEVLNYFLKRKLIAWISKRPKLFNNIQSGAYDGILEVHATQGIILYLGCFKGIFLQQYYHGARFQANADILLRQMAKVINDFAFEIEGEQFTIAITISLPPKSFKKILKAEKGVFYLQV